jgi:hypothetical protein
VADADKGKITIQQELIEVLLGFDIQGTNVKPMQLLPAQAVISEPMPWTTETDTNKSHHLLQTKSAPIDENLTCKSEEK